MPKEATTINRLDEACEFLALNYASSIIIDSRGERQLRILVEPRMKDIDELFHELRDTYMASGIDQVVISTASQPGEPKIGYDVYWSSDDVRGPYESADTIKPGDICDAASGVTAVFRSSRLTWAAATGIFVSMAVLYSAPLYNTVTYLLDV